MPLTRIVLTSPLGKAVSLQNGPYTHLIQHLDNYGGVLEGYVYGHFGVYYSYKDEVAFRNKIPLIATTNKLKAQLVLEEELGITNLTKEVELAESPITPTSKIYIFEHELVNLLKETTYNLQDRDFNLNLSIILEELTREFSFSISCKTDETPDISAVTDLYKPNLDDINTNLSVVGKYGDILKIGQLFQLLKDNM